MTRITTKVEGADRLKRTLLAAGDDLADLRRVNREAGDLVASGARGDVPVRSGALLGTIRSSGTERQGTASAGSAKVPYAGVIEFGWPARGIEAQPSLTGSLEANEEQLADLYQRETDRVLQQVKGDV